MSKDSSEVIAAARDVFLRYGFRRTTMGDLAREAGMSRPALYLLFPNKQALFRAVMIQYLAFAVEEIEAGIDERATSREKLEFIFEVWLVRTYEMLHRSPDAADLIDCSHEFASDIVEDIQCTLRNILSDILAPHAEAIAGRGMTHEQVAHVLAVSTRGFKDYVKDMDELRTVVDGMIGMTVAMLE